MHASPRRPTPIPVRAYRYSKWRWRVLVRLFDLVGAAFMVPWRLVIPPRRVPEPGKVLVVQLDHLGDAVLSTPLLARLRAAYPMARIDVLASASNRAVFEADPNVDTVHVAARNWFERRPGGWSLWSVLIGLGIHLRRERYELGIDVRGDVLTVGLLVLAGIPRRLGWSMGGGGFLLTDIARWVPGRHEVASRLAMLETLGINTEKRPRVVIGVSASDRALVEPLLHDPIHPDDADAPLLAVHLGAGTAAKRWPVRNWRELVRRFRDDGWRVVIVGAAEDAEASRQLTHDPGLIDLTGRLSVTETAAVLERADLFIGADSGPAHLAACAGVASVVLFSGTNLARQWRPWSRRSLVLRRRVACRPCHQKACPLADHPCMTGLEPARVHRLSLRWWNRVKRSEHAHATTF